MNIDTIKKILELKSLPFTLEEIESIMDEELSKDPDEMDTDLVDMCVDILEQGYAEQENESGRDSGQKREKTEKKPKMKKFTKVLLIAAIILLLIVIAVPVGAVVIHNEASEKIVRFYNDCFHVNLRNGDTDAEHYSDENDDLIRDLRKLGFDNIILPSDLLKFDYSEDIVIQKTEHIFSATAKTEAPESGIHGAIHIARYDEIASFAMGNCIIASEYKNAKQLNINGLDVLIFGRNDSTDIIIDYLDNNTDYHITLSGCDIDTAVKIAQTLK